MLLRKVASQRRADRIFYFALCFLRLRFKRLILFFFHCEEMGRDTRV